MWWMTFDVLKYTGRGHGDYRTLGGGEVADSIARQLVAALA